MSDIEVNTMDELGRPTDAAVQDALRAWAASFSEFSRRFGLESGLHVTDSEALVHIVNAEDNATPLTQTQLRRRIGLSTGATSSLLNRLEDAGYVERRRDQQDRRVVTLRSTRSMHDRVRSYFSNVADDFDTVLGQHDERTLIAVAGVIRDMTAVMERHLMPGQSASAR
jgi:MarR family transcriptional regulator, organic hydroperoxide resistance regulator